MQLRLIALLLAVLLCLGVVVEAVGADAKKTAPATNAPAALKPPAKRPKGLKPGEDLFRRDEVLRIRLEISKADMEQLRHEQRKYVRANLIEGNTIYRDIGVHLKGAAGSFRGVDDRPALTVSFDKFTPDQKFFGLSKIHLNNSVQDPSYMAEHLCGELFRAADVPATRVAFALVEINGRKLGLYVLKEGFTKEFLSLYFKQTSGNLYDGGFIKDITDSLEKDFGSGPNDHSDLKALVAAAQERDPEKRWVRLNETLDVSRFINFMVMENITWDWDGYPMNLNNYRVYYDVDTKRMVFFPHGTDQMFWEASGPLLGNLQGLVAASIMRTAEGRSLYRHRYTELFTNVFKLTEITNRFNALERRIKQALAPGDTPGPEDFSNQVREFQRKVIARAAGISRQLAEVPAVALRFAKGEEAITKWRRQDEEDIAQMEQTRDGNRNLLVIKTTRETTASWRARVTLPKGNYRFEGLAKAAGLKPVKDEKGEGAGLRISGTEEPRPNKLTGDADWQKLVFPIVVDIPFEEIELVCELRATAGAVWFDLDSLKLVREK